MHLQSEYFFIVLCLTFLNLESSFKSILYQHCESDLGKFLWQFEMGHLGLNAVRMFQ